MTFFFLSTFFFFFFLPSRSENKKLAHLFCHLSRSALSSSSSSLSFPHPSI